MKMHPVCVYEKTLKGGQRIRIEGFEGGHLTVVMRPPEGHAGKDVTLTFEDVSWLASKANKASVEGVAERGRRMAKRKLPVTP